MLLKLSLFTLMTPRSGEITPTLDLDYWKDCWQLGDRLRGYCSATANCAMADYFRQRPYFDETKLGDRFDFVNKVLDCGRYCRMRLLHCGRRHRHTRNGTCCCHCCCLYGCLDGTGIEGGTLVRRCHFSACAIWAHERSAQEVDGGRADQPTSNPSSA